MNTKKLRQIVEIVNDSIKIGYNISIYMGDINNVDKNMYDVPIDLESKQVKTQKLNWGTDFSGTPIIYFSCKDTGEEYNIPGNEWNDRLIYDIRSDSDDHNQKIIDIVERLTDISNRHDLNLEISGDLPLELSNIKNKC